MRRFRLNRLDDPTGVTGTGVVAEGCLFSDKTVVLRWLTDYPSTVVREQGGLKAVELVHGHGGSTQIEWIDDPA